MSAVSPLEDGLALIAALTARLGSAAVLVSDAARERAACDVYRSGVLPRVVVRPNSIAELAAAVGLSTGAGFSVVVRGGGASYTDGYIPINEATVAFDLSGLNKIVSIDEINNVVTVEAGCTWATLDAALAERNLRTPFFGPFSGLAATVGGAVSQHAVSHGSGRYGVSADSILSMDVVLASGQILSTGSAMIAADDANPRRFFRHNGPDLTGLFCGDCGALGVKATISLPLIGRPPATEALAFSFQSFDALHRAMAAIARLGVDDENFGLDIALQQGQIARNEATAAKMRLAWQLFRSAPSRLRGIADVARIAMAGDRHLREPGYSVSYLVKGPNRLAARAQASAIREAANAHGNEVPNTIPQVVASVPFAPLHNVLGPGGERWVPIHGILQHGDVSAFHRAYQELLESYRPRSNDCGVWTGAMYQTIGSSAFLYEIAFYWPDALNAYHRATLPPDFLQQLPEHAPNPEGAAVVADLKADAIRLFADFGAVHLQIGKAYAYSTRLSDEPVHLLTQIKQALDPDNRMNPGGLGFFTK